MNDMMQRFRVLTWPIVILAVLFGGSVAIIGSAILFPQSAPVVVVDARETDGIAVRGGWLDLTITLRRTKQCPIRVQRWLWQWVQVDGRKLKRWVQLDATGASPPTEMNRNETYVLSLSIPGNVQIGDWYYWSRAIDDCGEDGLFSNQTIRESANIPVKIEENNSNAPNPAFIKSFADDNAPR